MDLIIDIRLSKDGDRRGAFKGMILGFESGGVGEWGSGDAGNRMIVLLNLN